MISTYAQLAHLAAKVLATACLALTVLAPSKGLAQQRAITLDEAINSALDGNADLELARLRLMAREGGVEAAAGIFDTRVETSYGKVRELQQSLGSDGGASAIEQTFDSYSVALAKSLRSGLFVRPEFGVTRSGASSPAGSPTAVATVKLGIGIPLLQDRWGVVSRSTETAAEAMYRAEGHLLEYSAATAVFQSVVAYWRYASAHRQLAVFRASEDRARLLVEETGALVAGDERPAADLNHVRGNLASKRVTVLAAEQEVVAARLDLGIAMGLTAEDIALLPDPATPFAAVEQLSDTVDLARLVALALERRGDLAAARQRSSAGQTLTHAAENALRPRLDLTVSVGYTGTQIGSGFNQFFRPLYSHVPGVNTSVQLTYDFPISNDRARGQLAQQGSSLRQAELGERDLARIIAAEVDVALQALRRTIATVGEATRAVELHRATVESERLKHQLGVATLFDVILAEDALTSVLLGEVHARAEYMTALAVLRFHTGTIVEPHDGRFVSRADALRSVP